MTPPVPFTPRPGDFGLTQIGGYGGTLIRIGQWLNGGGFADFEHAFIYFGDGMIVEAMPRGAWVAPLARHKAERIAWYRAPDGTGKAIAVAAMGLRGTKYGFLDYLAIAADRLNLPLSTHLLRHQVKTSGRMICSQLVDEAYLRAGVHLFDDGRDPGQVTPADLYRLILNQRKGG